MKHRIEINNRDRYISKDAENLEESDFYQRWYSKFGEPQERTMSGDKFMERLKEMVDFE